MYDSALRFYHLKKFAAVFFLMYIIFWKITKRAINYKNKFWGLLEEYNHNETHTHTKKEHNFSLNAYLHLWQFAMAKSQTPVWATTSSCYAMYVYSNNFSPVQRRLVAKWGVIEQVLYQKYKI